MTPRPTLRLSENGNQSTEYDLDSLPIGGRFRVTNPYKPPTYGMLLEVGVGGCTVRLESGKQRVAFHGANGDQEFDALRSRTTRWQSKTPVEFLNEIQESLFDTNDSENTENEIEDNNMKKSTKKSAKSTKSANRKSATPSAKTKVTNKPAVAAAKHEVAAFAPTSPTSASATPMDPKARALVIRWKLAVTKLGELLKVDGPVDHTTAARDKVSAIYDEAVIAQVLLPGRDVGYSDPVFKSMELDAASSIATAGGGAGGANGGAANGAGGGAASPTTAVQGKAGRSQKKAPGKAAASASASKANGSAAPKAASARAKKVKDTHPCLCGCGVLVTGNFKQGHDTKYRSMLKRVERGEMKVGDLPKTMRAAGKNGEPLQFKSLASGEIRCINSVLAH